MTTELEPKAVRDARAKAKRLARSGGMSHQKALDRIARDEGHEHWASFLAASGGRTIPPTPAQQARPSIRTAATVARARRDAAAIENAASIAETYSPAAGRCVPILWAAWLAFMFTDMDVRTGLATVGAVLLLQVAAPLLGPIASRRARMAVHVAGLFLAAAFALASGILYATEMHPDWAATALRAAVGSAVVAFQGPNAMAIARPETVFLPKRIRTRILPRWAANAMSFMAILTMAGIPVAVVGLGMLMWEAGCVLFLHKVSMDVAEVGITTMITGIALYIAGMSACLFIDGTTAIRSTRGSLGQARQILTGKG